MNAPDDDRLPLWLLVGKRVQGTATRGDRRMSKGRVTLYLIRDVQVNPVTFDGWATEGAAVCLDHLWLKLLPCDSRQVGIGDRFRFEGYVAQYRRANGSDGVGVTQVRYLGKGAW